ncbi:MAG: AAA family ATPase [bacterium]|nr:AAA family ATPase [bacterium]
MSVLLNKLKESKKRLFVGMAGPGTGKSTSFKSIVESDEFKDKKILILSFINKLVDDLTEDFKNFENVTVLTLHAFAKGKLGDVDLSEDLDTIVSEDHFFINGDKIKYDHKFYENNLAEKEETFYEERRNFYKYEKELYSFNSIIYAVNRLFNKHEDKIPTEWDLILIDEFQDFNKSEYELIKLLNKKCTTVLVGDDYQSLYDWKKAEPKQIRDLYADDSTEEFSLDYCYRCTEVIVGATNDLIKNAKNKGYLIDSKVKNFLYPKDDDKHEKKHEVSKKYAVIDFISSVSGDKLIYELEKNIKADTNGEYKKRILILVPGYLKQTIYDGLIRKGFNIVEFELFSKEESNKIKHKNLIGTFETLAKRKTDNLALRKILSLYLSVDGIKELLQKNKKFWLCLSDSIKKKIEDDIAIFKKVKKGKDKLSEQELKRFNEIFNLKNLLSKMVKGFSPIAKGAIEVEMTTVMSSKGLSADFVYYVGIDDRNTLDKETKKFTDQKICEFLVGMTRAKEKLTLISLEDENPKILELLDKKYINKK